MNVVTGGTGHIGNVLVRELCKRGERVRVISLPGDDRSPLDGLNIEIVEGDILKPDSLRQAFEGADVIFHLAGMVSILPGQWNQLIQVNVQGTKNVIQACKDVGVRRLVYTSSIHALSRVPEGMILDETVPFGSQTDRMGEYDTTKALATHEVLKAVKEGLDAVIVCPTGVIGPNDYKGSELGELIQSCTKSTIQFYPDGAYDFVDVRDVAVGHILARNAGRSGEAYILSGERVTIKEIYELVREITKRNTHFVHVPYTLTKMIAAIMPAYYRLFNQKPQFTPYSIETVRSNSNISSEKAQAQLGYHPRPVRESIRDTIEWIQGREFEGAKCATIFPTRK